MSAAIVLFLLQAPVVETVRVVAKPLERASRLPAELLPYQRVAICAKVAGFVETVEVDRGSVVRRDQVLARLAAPEMKAQILEAESKLQAVEAQRAEAQSRLTAEQNILDRLRRAAETPGAVAGNDIVLAEKSAEAAKAHVESLGSAARAARAALDALREMEKYLIVTAPFDGVITERRVHPGALVGPSTGPLLDLEQVSRLRLLVPVPEADLGRLPMGERLFFTVPAYPGETFSGVVARAARSLDPKTRTMPVELDVDNAAGRLAPGMYPEVSWLVRRSRPSLLVPPAAVVTTTERSFVIRIQDGRAEWVDVARGSEAGGLVEVFGKLQPGDLLVRRGTDEIRNGTRLRAKTE